MSNGFVLYPPKPQFFDDDGHPLSGGSVEIYNAGTAILAEVFSDEPLSVPAANPITLNARGEPPTSIFLAYNDAFDIIVKDSLGATVYSVDDYIMRTTLTMTYLLRGAGSPEGAVTASVGTAYLRTDGGAGTTFYVKESGAGNVGWVAK